MGPYKTTSLTPPPPISADVKPLFELKLPYYISTATAIAIAKATNMTLAYYVPVWYRPQHTRKLITCKIVTEE